MPRRCKHPLWARTYNRRRVTCLECGKRLPDISQEEYKKALRIAMSFINNILESEEAR
jgi:hypothetical protein